MSATVQDMEARSNVARDLEWSFLGDYPCAYILFPVPKMGQWQQLNTKYSASLGAYTHDLGGYNSFQKTCQKRVRRRFSETRTTVFQ